MKRRLGGASIVAFMLAAHSTQAQAPANRSTAYLVGSDVTDARALWVNPASSAISHEASVHFDLTVRQPGGRGQLGQITAGFNARGLSFGYQRDLFSGRPHGHTYRLGLAGGAGRVAIGAAVALYRGGTSAIGWDLGARYEWQRQISLAGVLRNLGSPTVRGVRQDLVFVPAATLRPAGDLLAISVQALMGPSASRGYALEARVALKGRNGVGLIGRVDTDGSMRRRALVLGLSIGRADQVGLVGSTPGNFSEVDATSLYGVSSRAPH